MSAPKRTPRERLLDLFDFASINPPMGRSNSYGDAVLAFRREARRLIRAHERDLLAAAAERVATVTAHMDWMRDADRATVRAAILQRSATPKRGRR